MDSIILSDLEVFYRIGVPEAERAQPQRLLISVVLEHDLAPAAESDDLAQSIDYDAVARRLLTFGEGRHWKLIERLAADIARMILTEFGPQSVAVEVKKFVVAEARHVAVRLERRKEGAW